MITNTNHKLHVVENGYKKEIPHLQANKTQVLVGVPINLCHEETQIVLMFTEKTQTYIERLAASKLRPGDIMFGCQHY